MYCQLVYLRHCLPPTIRCALNELPETLDETYERTLLGINEEIRKYAHRLFQCLVVAVRPLRVDELAEVLAIRFDTGQLPQYRPEWRPKDTQDTVLSACHSLIDVVDLDGSPVVQFSHFSVKEFLTSTRLADLREGLSRFYILPQSAHTILAQASLSVLLHLDSFVDKSYAEKLPLAPYAAQYWFYHARFEDVSSSIQDVMEHLFDSDKPFLAAWIWLHDIDHPFREHMPTMHPTPLEAVPLYYATLCGLRSIAQRLVITNPEDINARGGHYGTPLHAALSKGHADVAMLLVMHGAEVDASDNAGMSPLHRASQSGRRDHVVLLLEHGADINGRNAEGETPLFVAAREGELDITRLLLQHGAAVDSRSDEGWSPLMVASRYGHSDVARVLLGCGANIDAQKANRSYTPLCLASANGHLGVAQLLIQYDAGQRFPLNSSHPTSQDSEGWTPLHRAARNGSVEVVELLLESTADVTTPNDGHANPFDLGTKDGRREFAMSLVRRMGNTDFQRSSHATPLGTPSHEEHVGNEKTSLHAACGEGNLDTVQSLLDLGANVNERNASYLTPLDMASIAGRPEVALLLVQYGADVNSRDKTGRTALHNAVQNGQLDIARLLLDHGADVNARQQDHGTPLHLASLNGHREIVQVLLECGADVNVRNDGCRTPSQLASRRGEMEIVKLLSEHGAWRG